MNQPSGDEASPDQGSDEEEFAPTPFDGPYFVPVVLFGLAAWFAYDGWISEDASLQEWWWFNQGGAVVWAVLGAWSLYKARRDAAAS